MEPNAPNLRNKSKLQYISVISRFGFYEMFTLCFESSDPIFIRQRIPHIISSLIGWKCPSLIGRKGQTNGTHRSVTNLKSGRRLTVQYTVMYLSKMSTNSVVRRSVRGPFFLNIQQFKDYTRGLKFFTF
jgi:hypothetical protein